MPNPTLTNDVLQELLRQIREQGPGFNGGAQYGGKFYAPVYGQGSYSGADNYTPGQLQEWQQYDPIQGASGNESVYNGKTAQRYDAQGNYIGDGTFTNVADQTPIKDLAKFAATAAALYGAGNFINNGFSGFGGGSGADGAVAGAEGAGSDVAASGWSGGTSSGLGSGTGDLGLGDITNTGGVGMMGTPAAGAASAPLPMGAGGWAAATMPAIGSTAATSMAFDPAFVGAAAASVPSVFRASVDSAAADAGPTDSSAPTGVDIGKTAGGLGTVAQILKDNPWLAPVLGGVLGSQPTTSSQSVAKKMDPRMDALVYGSGDQKGLLGNASDWYSANKSGMNATMTDANTRRKGLLTDPNIAKNFQSIGATGMGLLSRPMAGNPFVNGQMPQFGSSLMAQEMERRRRAQGGV